MRPHGTARRPRELAVATAVTLLSATAVSGLFGGCVSSAIGIAQCREIEYARCEASVPCGVIDDVDECKRFYRDKCLHGIAGPKIPTTAEQTACVSAITQAGQCAEDDVEGALESCDGGGGLGGQGPSQGSPTVCEFIAAPWESMVCDYLNEPPAEGGSSG